MDVQSKDVLRQIGQSVREERVRRRLTQDVLAKRAGMAATQLARMERGETDTGISRYVRVAAALGVPLAAILGGVEWDVLNNITNL